MTLAHQPTPNRLHPERPLPEQQYTIAETGQLLRLHPATVRRLIRFGELRAVGRGRLRRIALKDIIDFQERNRS